MPPFDGQGGLGKMVQLFGATLKALPDELTKCLSPDFATIHI
jgi:hypothetical protein